MDAIEIDRTFDAPIERVFDAWTTPGDFACWFGTDMVEIPADTLQYEAREGERWQATMRLPDGGTIDWSGEFVEVDPPHRLVLTLSDRPEGPWATVSVTLEAADPGTRMRMRQSGDALTPEQRAQAAAGYEGFFDTMADLVEG